MTIANLLTGARILAVPVFLVLVLSHYYLLALVLFFLAGVSDIIDGAIARFYNQKSRLGSFLDPIADKLLISSSFIVLAIVGLVPIWMMALVLARDLVILAGVLFLFFASKEFNLEPSMWGKVATAAQCSLIFLVLAAVGGWEITFLTAIASTATVLTTIISGLLYVSLGVKVFQGTGRGVIPF
ncbi:MAG: CDP-alcohol phosphatidyltransferase family protein [Thermodesulfobacteriota bacterium]